MCLWQAEEAGAGIRSGQEEEVAGQVWKRRAGEGKEAVAMVRLQGGGHLEKRRTRKGRG